MVPITFIMTGKHFQKPKNSVLKSLLGVVHQNKAQSLELFPLTTYSRLRNASSRTLNFSWVAFSKFVIHKILISRLMVDVVSKCIFIFFQAMATSTCGVVGWRVRE